MSNRPKVRITHIQAFVASRYGLHQRVMKSKRRTRRIAHARQIAMFLSRELTANSITVIGRLFGGRDHSTIIHGVRVVRRRVDTHPMFKIEMNSIECGLLDQISGGTNA